MVCFAAKWLGVHTIHFSSIYHDGREDMLSDMWNLLDEADAVIHYNGRRFDIPHINREFLEQGYLPPSPYKQIDLLSAVKKQFRFPSNKLEYVASRLGIGEKLKHEGFDLWIKCMAGEESAWKLMKQYNVNDVALTEALYHRLQPWIPSIPSYSAHDSNERMCPACGGVRLIKRGFAYTIQSRYQRYVCDECGKWSRDTKRTDGVTIRPID